MLSIASCTPTPQGGATATYGEPEAPKKIGLVLGGGGAKGAATIGALKIIEQSGVQVDYVAGTSIGAVIGALYCAGYTADELSQLFASLQWTELIKGNLMEEKFKALLAERGVVNFEDLQKPFSCVAVNVGTGADDWLSSGLVYKAMRASMSIPPLYMPVELGDVKYLDGGFLNNLPVDVVRDMGADIVIAIDLQQDKEETDFQNLAETLSSMRNADMIGGIIGSLLGQEYEFMFRYLQTRPDTVKYVQNRRNSDIYINPVLTGCNATSFGKWRRMMEIGDSTAKQQIWTLKKLTISQKLIIDTNNIRTY